jgi:hypothetical protein
MQYLATRAGVKPDPGELDRLMMAGLFTDPRLIHAYDVLPTAMRDEVAAQAAATQQQLLWNRRLFDALKEGHQGLAKRIKEQMKSMGVPEFMYRELSPGDRARLARRLDQLNKDLLHAVSAKDVPLQKRLAEKLGEGQALLNVSEGGGYGSAGGVRRYVSERPGESGFPRLPGGEAHFVPQPERLTAILDQFAKLDHAALDAVIAKPEELAKGIRKIGKYCDRLATTMREAGMQALAWQDLATKGARLKRMVSKRATVSRLASGRADLIVRQAERFLDDVVRRSNEALVTVTRATRLPNVGNAASAAQNLTRAHVKLLRATDALRTSFGAHARAIRTGYDVTKPSPKEKGTAKRKAGTDRTPA